MITCVVLAAPPAGALQPSDPRFDFQVREGLNSNYFVRAGAVAAHLVVRDGTEPRILIAFPAGNSGVGLWFGHQAKSVQWTVSGKPRALYRVDARGRALYGISADMTVEVPELEVRQAVLSSIRVLRDYQQLAKVPTELAVRASAAGHTLRWARDRLDGAAGYQLELEVTHGNLSGTHVRAGSDGRIGLRLAGLTGEKPLTGLMDAELLKDPAAADPAARNVLTFLAYREKLLAGSWRFDTYFGRDTLMSVRLLMPALSPQAIAAGVGAVLARLSPAGEVAHEEDIGERAVLDHLRDGGTPSAAPVYDYKMIDGNFLLAPVLAAWLLHSGHEDAARYLAAAVDPLQAHAPARGAALLRNLRLVLRSAAPFVAQPVSRNLIALKPGIAVGEWRDSEIGLGGGRFPYDVNAALVPAALTACGQLYASGLLSPYLGADDRELFQRAAQMADVWRARAPPLFDVTVSAVQAARAIQSYAAAQGVPAQPALAAMRGADARFHALALDATGKPIPVLHSDEGFELLFDEPDPPHLEQAVHAALLPFPAGLLTGAGMVVANPVYADSGVQKKFTRNAYHGTVIWSWQQALFAAGLARQLERTDLPAGVRSQLQQAQRSLWSAIHATRAMSNSELWSWGFSNGHYRVAPFGAAAADADESNAAQLWSTVYLAIKAPSP